MSIEEIDALEEEDKNSGKAPRAQYVLAEAGHSAWFTAKKVWQRPNVLPQSLFSRQPERYD